MTRIHRYMQERIWWRLLDAGDWIMRRDTRAPAVPVVRQVSGAKAPVPIRRKAKAPVHAGHSRRKRAEWLLADRWRDLAAGAALVVTLVATAVVLASEGGDSSTPRVADATASVAKVAPPQVTTVAVKGVADSSPAVDLAAEQRKLKRRELRKERAAVVARHHRLEQKHNALKRKKRANARERARRRRARAAQATPSTPAATTTTPATTDTTTTPSTPTTQSTPTYTPPTHSTPTHSTPTHSTPSNGNSGNSGNSGGGSVFDDQG